MNNHTRITIEKTLAAVLSVILSIPASVLPAFAADPVPVLTASFQGVEIADDFVTIKLSTPVLYSSFLTQTPPRLVMELLDTKHEGSAQSAPGKGQFLFGVRSSQFEKTPRLITRVVMDLVKMAGYKVGTAASGLTVEIVGPIADAVAAPVKPAVAVKLVVAKRAAAAAKASVPAAVPGPLPATISAPAAAQAPAANPESEPAPRPKARVADAGQAMRRVGLDKTMTRELAAAAQSSDVSKTKIDITDDGDGGELPDRRVGGRIFRDIMSRMPRDPITISFDNTDIREVIKLFAAKAKVNVVVGPDVAGTLTLHLTQVPFNEAFRTALSMMKLTTDQVGDNILRVITPAELTKQRTTSTAITRVFQINYAKAGEVKTTLDAVRAAEGRAGNSTADTKTNTLIVTDTLEGLLSTENLLTQLDQRPRQVLITAKLVEVNVNAGLNYGVQWDFQGVQIGKVGGQQGNTRIGTLANPAVAASPVTMPLDQNANTVLGVGAAGRGTGVNLGNTAFGALTLGRVTNNFMLNATLTAAATEGKAKVLSEPKVATLNNQAANINVTTQTPYSTSNVSATGAQSNTVTYVTTGIKLTVTPSINADGRITLDINPDVSQPSVTTPGAAPAIDARTVKTTVLVRDGETIVIGGLISDSFRDTISKVPLFGDIPILGWLFKKKTRTRERVELLIFVTTRILSD